MNVFLIQVFKFLGFRNRSVPLHRFFSWTIFQSTKSSSTFWWCQIFRHHGDTMVHGPTEDRPISGRRHDLSQSDCVSLNHMTMQPKQLHYIAQHLPSPWRQLLWLHTPGLNDLFTTTGQRSDPSPIEWASDTICCGLYALLQSNLSPVIWRNRLGPNYILKHRGRNRHNRWMSMVTLTQQ